jgi:phage anti-repressor protein
MNELILKELEATGMIRIYKTDNEETVVDARELHTGLCVSSRFNDWVANRLIECEALENNDFISYTKNLVSGGRTKEYYLKLDLAKEMAMLERNEKGREYRRYFIEVEKRFKQNQIDVSNLSPELQLFKSIFNTLANMELASKEVKQEIQDMRNVISLDSNSWRKDGHDLIVKAAQKLGGNENISVLTTEVYDLIDARCSVSLSTRLTYKRRRMAEEGVCKSKRDKLNKMDVIADDKKLIEIYMAIVKELAIKYGVA